MRYIGVRWWWFWSKADEIRHHHSAIIIYLFLLARSLSLARRGRVAPFFMQAHISIKRNFHTTLNRKLIKCWNVSRSQRVGEREKLIFTTVQAVFYSNLAQVFFIIPLRVCAQLFHSRDAARSQTKICFIINFIPGQWRFVICVIIWWLIWCKNQWLEIILSLKTYFDISLSSLKTLSKWNMHAGKHRLDCGRVLIN